MRRGLEAACRCGEAARGGGAEVRVAELPGRDRPVAVAGSRGPVVEARRSVASGREPIRKRRRDGRKEESLKELSHGGLLVGVGDRRRRCML